MHNDVLASQDITSIGLPINLPASSTRWISQIVLSTIAIPIVGAKDCTPSPRSDEINALKSEDKIDYIAGSVGMTIINSLREALRTISDSNNPFFIMAEQTHNDGGGHGNNMATVITATTNYNEEIAYAIQFTLCHPKTVLIVTADHETGGIVPDEGSKEGFKFTTTNHTGADVPIFAIGPSTEVFNDVRTENIDIARFIAKAFGAETFGQAEELDPAA